MDNKNRYAYPEELYSTSSNNSLIDELMDKTNYDIMDQTLELDTLKLDDEENQILMTDAKKPKDKKKRRFHLPITTAEHHHLEYAFVHCSILGFITAFIGIGTLTFIFLHIPKLY